MVLRDDNTKPQHARIIEEYKKLQNIASLLFPSLSLDLHPIEHLWDELGRRFRNWEQDLSILPELRKAKEGDRLPRLKCMKLVTSIIKTCLVDIRKNGGYTQFLPEVADNCEPFRAFFHHIQKMYAPKTIFRRNDNYHDLIVVVLLTLGLHFVFFEFCKIDG